MNVRRIIPAGLAFATLISAAGGVLADDSQRYGWQLMTPEERAEHRQTMRSLESEKDRAAYRLKHHETMRARAAEQGVTLPEKPAPRGKGYGRRRGSTQSD